MTKIIVSKDRKAQCAATWRTRYDAAFRCLDPKVQALKSIRAAQIATSTGVVILLLGGRPISAALLAGAWFGSRPLTRLAAAGAACVGAINDAAQQAIQRRRGLPAGRPEGRRPSKARRQRRARAQETPAPTPMA